MTGDLNMDFMFVIILLIKKENILFLLVNILYINAFCMVYVHHKKCKKMFKQ